MALTPADFSLLELGMGLLLLPVLITGTLTYFVLRKFTKAGFKMPLVKAFLISHAFTCVLMIFYQIIVDPTKGDFNIPYYLYSFLMSFPLVGVVNLLPASYQNMGGPLLNASAFVVWGLVQWGAVLLVVEKILAGRKQKLIAADKE